MIHTGDVREESAAQIVRPSTIRARCMAKTAFGRRCALDAVEAVDVWDAGVVGTRRAYAQPEAHLEFCSNHYRWLFSKGLGYLNTGQYERLKRAVYAMSAAGSSQQRRDE